jgi:hypothetical protein
VTEAEAADAGSPEAFLDALLQEVKGFMEGSDFEDDFTGLAVERHARSSGRSRSASGTYRGPAALVDPSGEAYTRE